MTPTPTIPSNTESRQVSQTDSPRTRPLASDRTEERRDWGGVGGDPRQRDTCGHALRAEYGHRPHALDFTSGGHPGVQGVGATVRGGRRSGVSPLKEGRTPGGVEDSRDVSPLAPPVVHRRGLPGSDGSRGKGSSRPMKTRLHKLSYKCARKVRSTRRR